MSLYWYVASKEKLHQLMLERVQAEAEAPEPSGDWRADLRAYARNTRAALLRHPWAVDFLGIGPPSGATAGLTEGEITEFITESGRRIRDSGRYPHLTRILDAGVDPDSPQTRDERFEFGLDCVLDGIAVRLGV
jgi:AcrR family transcriptional regulator